MTTEVQPPRHLEILAAFADGERVATNELREALATAEGRDYLIDLVALREVVRVPADQATTAVDAAARSHKTRIWLGIAAMLLTVLVAGYQVGRRVAHSDALRAPVVAPAPDRVIPFTWDESKRGE